MWARTASSKRSARLVIWAMPRHIIFHSAARLKPHAPRANPLVELTAPTVLWHNITKTRGLKVHGHIAEETIMQRTKPPFRADHVGSILRTAPVKQARAQREKGEIGAAHLKEIEDRE